MNSTPENYNTRSKLYLKAFPKIIEQTAGIKGKWAKKSFTKYVKLLQKTLDEIPQNIPVVMLVIPHCSQVNAHYYETFNRIGAKLPPIEQHTSTNYPFVSKIDSAFKMYPNVHILNPMEAFQKQERNGVSLYYENDPHLNEKGQKEIGELLKQELTELLIR